MATTHAQSAIGSMLQPVNFFKHHIAIEKDNPAKTRAANALANAFDRTEFIREYRRSPDPMMTEAKFYSEVAKMVDKAEAATLAELSAAEIAMKQAIIDADRKLNVASGIKPTQY
ncbi:MAG: hypothetical protein EON93_12845, partial [Burkholderiales bacterium]